MNEDNWWLKYTREKDRVRGWGTVLDEMDHKSIPPQYIGSSFFEANHDDIEVFTKMSTEEKWLKAYWAEQQAMRNGVTPGFWFGLIAGMILFSILVSIFVS